mmetsp:Transcript_11601/g.20605  ORF Transcript_11601/g.20605 Transcript_11601/m.20605 type:complete len:99 (+) Transcript_11601:143-439(+)
MRATELGLEGEHDRLAAAVLEIVGVADAFADAGAAGAVETFVAAALVVPAGVDVTAGGSVIGIEAAIVTVIAAAAAVVAAAAAAAGVAVVESHLVDLR